MTDPEFPDDPRVPSTIPSGPDDDLRDLIYDLRAALANVGDLCTRLDTKLATVILAERAEELEIGRLRERVGRLEGLAAE